MALAMHVVSSSTLVVEVVVDVVCQDHVQLRTLVRSKDQLVWNYSCFTDPTWTLRTIPGPGLASVPLGLCEVLHCEDQTVHALQECMTGPGPGRVGGLRDDLDVAVDDLRGQLLDALLLFTGPG